MSTKYRSETATVPFPFAVNNPDGSGAVDADSTPSAYLHEADAAAIDAPITTGVSVQLLSNAAYPAGLYRVIVDGTTAGLSADSEYDVYVEATVGGVVCTAVVGTLVTTPLMDSAGIRAAIGMAAPTYDDDIANLPTTGEFELRTKLAADYAEQSTVEGIEQSLLDYESGASRIQVNVKEVNSVEVIGVGTSGDKWRAV